MALNFPGPYEVRIFYTCNGLTHNQRLNCRIAGTPTPGTPFDEINVLRRDDTDFPLDGEVDDWLVLMAPFFNDTDTDFVRAELWKYEAESFNADYISTYELTATGSSGSVNHLAGQLIFTFRTIGGGVMKLSLMEGISVPAVSTTPPYAGVEASLTNAIITGTSPWLGRDGTYPFANIARHPGQSESVFKRRFRQL